MKNNKPKLVVEVIGAHNLMPKDGEGSSSPFVEVEFENQRLRTKVLSKELNPVWNEKLVFHVTDVNDLPYRSLEVNVFNEKKTGSSRNFLGKVRVSGSNVGKQGEEIAQLYTLDKRSLFSHVRGEISLKLYVSCRDDLEVADVKKVVSFSNNSSNNNNGSSNNVGGGGGGGGGNGNGNVTVIGKGKKKVQNQTNSVTFQQQNQNHMVESSNNNGGGGKQQGNFHFQGKNGDLGKNHGEIMNPVVITTLQNGGVPLGGGGGNMGIYANGGLSNEFSLKETKPHLGGGLQNKDKTSSTYDLVEQMQYLYVRVVKARDLSVFGGGEVLAEVKLGNYKGITKRVSINHADWDQVFAFSKDCIQSSMVEVFVKERENNDFLGRIWFDLNEVPKRAPPDSQLAPQWYRMEDKRGDKSKAGEIMVSIWFGTQADEAFSEAWHSKAANVHLDGLCSIKSKVYLSPKLWYLRVGVIEAQDIVLGEKGSSLMRYPECFVKVQVGNQVLRTRVSPSGASRPFTNPFWNEDLIFVVPEPFEDYLLVSIEDRIAPGREEVVGRLLFPVAAIDRRWDDKAVPSRWFNLDNNNHSNQFMNMGDPSKNRFGSRVHIRASLDGGYHVLDESTMYSSDLRATAKQLWKPHIGVLEMGIIGATGLMPMKIKEGKGGTTDAYCVAKYGQKWVRTRTVIDSLSPKWNEQYTWEVFDPCTVITIGVFDNCRIDRNIPRDSRIGKVRIRLSTLETDRVYTHSYPLLFLHTNGVKKMGELHLAVRFSCTNMGNMLHMYTTPLLPKMHYVQPLSVNQLESLRYQATNVVAARLSRSEPSLGREVVEYMLDHDSHMWSMRRSKANFFRLMNVISGTLGLLRWVEEIRTWTRPVYSSLFVVKFLLLVIFPELIIPTVLTCMAIMGIWRFKSRPRHPPHMDTTLSRADSVYPDELDEEFDSFPTSRNSEIVRIRYDRLRSVAGRIQTVVGDMATQGERFQALLSWRDPRATILFVGLCLVAAIGFYVVPVKAVVVLWGLYYLRPPKFRSKLPPKVFSFFRRLPSKADSLL